MTFLASCWQLDLNLKVFGLTFPLSKAWLAQIQLAGQASSLRQLPSRPCVQGLITTQKLHWQCGKRLLSLAAASEPPPAYVQAIGQQQKARSLNLPTASPASLTSRVHKILMLAPTLKAVLQQHCHLKSAAVLTGDFIFLLPVIVSRTGCYYR